MWSSVIFLAIGRKLVKVVGNVWLTFGEGEPDPDPPGWLVELWSIIGLENDFFGEN